MVLSQLIRGIVPAITAAGKALMNLEVKTLLKVGALVGSAVTSVVTFVTMRRKKKQTAAIAAAKPDTMVQFAAFNAEMASEEPVRDVIERVRKTVDDEETKAERKKKAKKYSIKKHDKKADEDPTSEEYQRRLNDELHIFRNSLLGEDEKDAWGNENTMWLNKFNRNAFAV